jgi:hypothetical protein
MTISLDEQIAEVQTYVDAWSTLDSAHAKRIADRFRSINASLRQLKEIEAVCVKTGFAAAETQKMLEELARRQDDAARILKTRTAALRECAALLEQDVNVWDARRPIAQRARQALERREGT